MRNRLVGVVLFSNVCLAAAVFALSTYVHLPLTVIVLALFTISLIDSFLLARLTVSQATKPLENIWQAVLHVSPSRTNIPAPDLDSVTTGKELVTALVTQIYQLASQESTKDSTANDKQALLATNVINSLPIPLFVFNKDQTVVTASRSAIEYSGLETGQLIGKPLYDIMDFEFSSEHTLEK